MRALRLPAAHPPSSPGEFRPEALTDPDMTLSRHPARATRRRLPPSIDNPGVLRFPVDPWSRSGDPLPSLDGHCPTSSLLRRSPPQPAASVLSASDCRPCAFSLAIGKLVPAVPRRSLCPTHAPCTPAAIHPILRAPDGLIPGEKHAPGFDDT